ncbi:MAG: rhomboid family intramembrane serine protease, partial [Gallicola sp.]|nr:rhomboid family intramembrane serine protease [Gallicola sp.]
IYGLFAFHLYLFILNKESYMQIFGTQMFGVIVINLVYTVTNPSIDKAGHIFGLLGGLAIYFFFDKFSRHPERLKKIALGFLVLLMIATGFKYRTYKYSEEYYVAKFSYYYYKEDLEKALQVEQEYIQHHGKK